MKFVKLPELTDAIGIRLQKALGCDAEIIAREVADKTCELWECNGGDAYMVTRVEDDDLVCVCYEGKDLKHAAPHLIAAAKAKGLNACRFHTKRTALARLLKDYKPVLSEYVYRIYVNG